MDNKKQLDTENSASSELSDFDFNFSARVTPAQQAEAKSLIDGMIKFLGEKEEPKFINKIRVSAGSPAQPKDPWSSQLQQAIEDSKKRS